MVRFHVKYSYYNLKKKKSLLRVHLLKTLPGTHWMSFTLCHIQSSCQGAILIKIMMIFIECLPYEQLWAIYIYIFIYMNLYFIHLYAYMFLLIFAFSLYKKQLSYFTNQNSDSSICKLNIMGPYLNFNLNSCFHL